MERENLGFNSIGKRTLFAFFFFFEASLVIIFTSWVKMSVFEILKKLFAQELTLIIITVIIKLIIITVIMKIITIITIMLLNLLYSFCFHLPPPTA